MPQRDGLPRAVRVFAPASISNLGCGFDIFGVALEGPGGRGHRPRRGWNGNRVPVGDRRRRTRPDGSRPQRCRAGSPRRARTAGIGGGHRDRGPQGDPPRFGTGRQRGERAVAGAVAADALLGCDLDPIALLECAMIGESKGSGANHADNAAPSLVGGFVLVLPGRPTRMVQLPTPDDMIVAVAHPAMEVETLRARMILDDTVPLEAGIQQWGEHGGTGRRAVHGRLGSDRTLRARCGGRAGEGHARTRLQKGQGERPGGGGRRSGSIGFGALDLRALPGKACRTERRGRNGEGLSRRGRSRVGHRDLYRESDRRPDPGDRVTITTAP